MDNSDAIAGADPDGDGLTNLEEYLGGTDPTVAEAGESEREETSMDIILRQQERIRHLQERLAQYRELMKEQQDAIEAYQTEIEAYQAEIEALKETMSDPETGLNEKTEAPAESKKSGPDRGRPFLQSGPDTHGFLSRVSGLNMH